MIFFLSLFPKVIKMKAPKWFEQIGVLAELPSRRQIWLPQAVWT